MGLFVTTEFLELFFYVDVYSCLNIDRHRRVYQFFQIYFILQLIFLIFCFVLK